MDINIIFTLGNLMLFIANVPLIYTVWRNREVLSDFNPIGSFMTFLGILTFNAAYIQMENWASILFSSTTVMFWGAAAFFSVKRYLGCSTRSQDKVSSEQRRK